MLGLGREGRKAGAAARGADAAGPVGICELSPTPLEGLWAAAAADVRDRTAD